MRDEALGMEELLSLSFFTSSWAFFPTDVFFSDGISFLVSFFSILHFSFP